MDDLRQAPPRALRAAKSARWCRRCRTPARETERRNRSCRHKRRSGRGRQGGMRNNCAALRSLDARARWPSNAAPLESARMDNFSFYEFFCGGGMARAGLGEGWSCLFANDFDAKKAQSYAENWGEREIRCADVGALTSRDLPGARRSRLGLVSLPGPFARRPRRRAFRRALGRVLAVLATDAGPCAPRAARRR